MPSFIIVGYVWRILGRGDQKGPPIREQSRKSLSWKGLKKELIGELVSVEDKSSKLSNLTSRFDGFLGRYEILDSDLTVNKNCNRLLNERIVQLKRNAVSNAQYPCHESCSCIYWWRCSWKQRLQGTSLIGHEVKPDDFKHVSVWKKGHSNS